MKEDKQFVFDINGKKFLIIHRDAVTVEELIKLGKELGCIGSDV